MRGCGWRSAASCWRQGVTIFYPHTCVIDSDVEVGADTVIEPFVQLLGNTKIGEDCRIRSYSVIENSVLGDRVTVKPGTIMEDSRVAAGAVLGPYTHMRPGSEVGEDAHLGNFVETKKIKLGKGSKANHLTYLGDAEIGEGVNIGAGTITCNYDGVNKHKTIIEDGVFIGSDCDAGGTGKDWTRRLRCGGKLHHGRRAGGCAGARTCAAKRERGLGAGEARNAGRNRRVVSGAPGSLAYACGDSLELRSGAGSATPALRLPTSQNSTTLDPKRNHDADTSNSGSISGPATTFPC